MPEVHICEVGPRDALQNAKHMMPTAAKKAWISALAAAGLKEIEVGSFVPPKLIPAMADTGEIVAHARTIPGLTVVALAPNLKGYQRAVEAGAHKVTFPVSASRAHSESNVRMTPDQMVAEVRKCAALGGAPIEGAISTAFGCTLQGEVPEKEVVRLAVALAEFCDSVALADTVVPLEGVRVVEFAHMVMGPSCGLVLADLGADVVKVEPLRGDNTRRLEAAGAGFFPVFNRNKKSLAVDLARPEGKRIVLKLLETADVLTENFRPGALDKLGFSYEILRKENPKLIYCSLKGFLKGPYEHRLALDEVTQMMGGLAYMTGLPDRPLRAGSSVIDIMGGTFAAVGILAALRERETTGQGKRVTSSLFESTAYLVAQHMAQYELTGEAPPPMSVKRPAWGVYDIFETRDGDRLFVGVVTDTQWEVFCREFGQPRLAADPRLKTNGMRVKERAWLLPQLAEVMKKHSKNELAAKLEAIGLPFAPIAKPWDLLDDLNLKASGGLLETRISGKTIRVPALPLDLGGQRLPKRSDPPDIGEHGPELLAELGCSPQEIRDLRAKGIVAFPAGLNALK